MDKLRKDMEISKGQTVVLSTGLKDNATSSRDIMDDDEEEEEEQMEDLDIGQFDEEDDYIDEDEDDDDEEIASFSF